MPKQLRKPLLALLFIVFACAPATGTNLLSNPSFELFSSTAGAMPPGWDELFGKAATWGSNLKLIADGDEHSLVILDASDQQSMGLRSQRVPVEPGRKYEASASVRGTPIGQYAGLYIEFWNKDNQRIFNKYAKGNLTEAWQRVEVAADAPAGAVSATILLYSYIPNVCESYFDKVSLVEASSSIGEVAQSNNMTPQDVNPDDTQLDYRPAEGALITTNPASFVWVPVNGATNYELQFSTSPQFVPEETRVVQGISLSIYTPSSLMNISKEYYWRVRGVAASGQKLAWSAPRRFVYDRHAAELPGWRYQGYRRLAGGNAARRRRYGQNRTDGLRLQAHRQCQNR